MSTTERIVLLLNIVYVYFSSNTVTKKVDLWQVYIECRRCRQDVKVYVLAVWPLSSATRRPAFMQFTGCQQPVKRSYPRANGAKRRARVLIPHGYLHPGKGKHSEV